MSDLLIRGMEMPIDGFITVTITSDGRVVGNSKRERDKFEYLDNEDIATAVPAPPHERLISADALKETIEVLIEKHLHGYTKSTWDFVCELRSIISDAPTIPEINV